MKAQEARKWLAHLTGARSLAPTTLRVAIVTLPIEEWMILIELVEKERVAAIVAEYLQQIHLLQYVPDKVLTRLQNARRRTHLEFIVQVDALNYIVSGFQTANIPFRLLKGCAQAILAYPVPSTRAVGDIDIWIRPQDLPRSRAVLKSLGLVQAQSTYPQPFVYRYLGEQVFSIPDSMGLPVVVDLHWHLTNFWWFRNALHVPEKWLFSQTQNLDINGVKVPTLDPTNTLFYLCLHVNGGLHAQGWRFLLDIYLLLRNKPINWVVLNSLVQDSQAHVIIWRALNLIDIFFGTQYEKHLWRRPPWWHRAILNQLLPSPSPGYKIPEQTRDLQIPLYHLLLLPEPTSILFTLLHMLWPPRIWIQFRYQAESTVEVRRARLLHLMRLRGLIGIP